ncbi:ATPase [Nocardiopsis rhodophaea]|uniref:ATPase n=1 Tax=Nocardiopsis rhodophaea TaxID=280238 RepID=A0ABN2T0L9_9ACTN
MIGRKRKQKSAGIKSQRQEQIKKAQEAGAEEQEPPRRRPGMRGWPGRATGQAGIVQMADEWRGTTVQVCGMWPFAIGTGTPMVGVPIGRNLHSGATLCCDPISWFQRAKLISNPSAFVLGKPGLGKSTIIRRMATGLAGYGVQPLVLGDLKPDYVDLIEALGGQVITLGRGRGHLNILDPGESKAAAERLTGKARSQIIADGHGRRLTMVSALLTIMRSAPPSDREETILDRALKVLDDRHDGIPVLPDLLKVIQEAPDEVRQVALDRGSMDRYREVTDGLEASLIGLVGGGRLGETFSKPTTNPMVRDRPVVFDVSAIDDSEMDLQAAVLLACWSAGFGTANVANALADAGLEPRRHYFVILDELWRALRAGRGMVDRVDALTRLNRQRGVGMAMCSHTMSDLMSLSNEEDRMKAKGFVERSGMVICGGLPSAEMPMLQSAVPFSQAEQDMLIGWQDPPAWDPSTNKEAEPPGRGKFLVKVGGRPGIPVSVQLTSVEAGINDTNKLWHQTSRVGRATQDAEDAEAAEVAESEGSPKTPDAAAVSHTPDRPGEPGSTATGVSGQTEVTSGT